MEKSEEIKSLLKAGRSKLLVPLITEELAKGADAKEILGDLMDAMADVGERFKKDEIFVPEVLIAARAMNNSLVVLKPYLAKEGVEPVATGLICTVKGDLHDVGKNLVKMMIESAGIKLIDLGVDVDAQTIVQAIKDNNAKLVCLSALLTTTMPYMEEIVKAIKEAGLRDQVKIMVGGAPLSQEFCDKIGADAYTPDAGSAAQIASSFFKK